MRNVTLADWKPTKNQIKLVNKVLKSGRLTYGPITKEFENKFAKLHKRKYAIFTNSGTSALQVALHYLKETYKWQDGDEVIIPAVTFVATANVVLQNGLKPVPVDIDEETFNIDPNLIEDELTAKTRAIIPVDLLGRPCDMKKISTIAKRFNLKIIEDSCETMFVKHKGYPVGHYADIVCFSSYLAHIISTGVGGFLVTDNKKWADDMRSMVWHGRDNLYLSIDDNKKVPIEKLIHARFLFNRVGYSYRLTELEAALGLDELKRSKQIIKARQKNASYLYSKLQKLNLNLVIPKIKKGEECAWMFFPLVYYDRDNFAIFLEKRGIQTRWIMPLINQPVYKGMFKKDHYPVAGWLNCFGLLIGIHQFLTKKDLDWVVLSIKEYFNV